MWWLEEWQAAERNPHPRGKWARCPQVHSSGQSHVGLGSERASPVLCSMASTGGVAVALQSMPEAQIHTGYR